MNICQLSFTYHSKGNPSDGFRGKTVSFLIENYSATVEVEANPVGGSSIRILDPLEVDGFIALKQHSRNIVRALYLFMNMYVCINVFLCMHTCISDARMYV